MSFLEDVALLQNPTVQIVAIVAAAVVALAVIIGIFN